MVSVWDYNSDYCSGSSSNNSNKKSNKIQKKEQIPTEYNEEQTLRIIRKQDQIPGEGRRSKIVNDMPSATALAEILKDLEFPADKSKIVEFTQQKKTNDPKCNQILPILYKTTVTIP
jgi:hypothetical protein